MTQNISEQLESQQPLTLDKGEKYVYAKRYSFLARIQHWVNVILMILFFFTGYEIFVKKFLIGDFQNTQSVHITMGYIIFFWSILFYLSILLGERKLKTIIPTPRDVLDLILIIGCATGILDDSKYPHYDFYDPVNKRYHMKYHPTQKFLSFANLFMLLIIGVTGFAMYRDINPLQESLLADVSYDIMLPIIEFGINLRLIHFIVFIYFIISTSIHFYFTMLRANRSRLSGMVSGTEKLKDY